MKKEKLTEDEEIYYELLKEYWQDGVIQKEEQIHLGEMRENLNITIERAYELGEIVKEELGISDESIEVEEEKIDLYRKLFESFTRKGMIDEKKRGLLNKKADSLGIPIDLRIELESELYFDRARILKEEKKTEEALFYIEAALSLKPDCEKFKEELEKFKKEEEKEEEKRKLKEFMSLQLADKLKLEEERKKVDEARRIEEEDRRKREEARIREEEEKKRLIRFSELSPEMVFVPGGVFYLGSNKGNEDEIPVHKVELSPFYMAKYPVMNKDYSKHREEYKNLHPDLPLVKISWYDAVIYCNWLSEQDGLDKCYEISKSSKKPIFSWLLGEENVGPEETRLTVSLDIKKEGYRLPTEAEWEYACRSGSATEYYWGDTVDEDYFWYSKNSGGIIHPAGEKLPNDFGLYDMSGNILEWCWDSYDKSYYGASSYSNPAGPSSGMQRIRRGGSCKDDPFLCRSACRKKAEPVFLCDITGFRTVRTFMQR